MYTESFSVSQLNALYFEKMLALAERHGIKAYWVTLPSTKRVYDYRKTIGYQDDFSKFLNKFVLKGQLDYLQNKSLVYEDQYFDDLSHLNTPGAIRFSTHLNDLIKQC